MKASHDEALEKERIQNKKQVTKQKEDFDATVSGKDREIDALKLFSKTKSEYVTDMRLIGIRDRLVKEKRIRPEDMHIMANIFYQVMNSMILNALVTLYLRVQAYIL